NLFLCERVLFREKIVDPEVHNQRFTIFYRTISHSSARAKTGHLLDTWSPSGKALPGVHGLDGHGNLWINGKWKYSVGCCSARIRRPCYTDTADRPNTL